MTIEEAVHRFDDLVNALETIGRALESGSGVISIMLHEWEPPPSETRDD